MGSANQRLVSAPVEWAPPLRRFRPCVKPLLKASNLSLVNTRFDHDKAKTSEKASETNLSLTESGLDMADCAQCPNSWRTINIQTSPSSIDPIDEAADASLRSGALAKAEARKATAHDAFDPWPEAKLNNNDGVSAVIADKPEFAGSSKSTNFTSMPKPIALNSRMACDSWADPMPIWLNFSFEFTLPDHAGLAAMTMAIMNNALENGFDAIRFPF